MITSMEWYCIVLILLEDCECSSHYANSFLLILWRSHWMVVQQKKANSFSRASSSCIHNWICLQLAGRSLCIGWKTNAETPSMHGWDGFVKTISASLVFIHQQESSEKDATAHRKCADMSQLMRGREREEKQRRQKNLLSLLNEWSNGRSRNQIRRQKIHGTWKRLKWFDGQLFPCVIIGGFIAEVRRVFPIRLVERIDGRGFFETGIHFPMIN